MHTRLFVLRLAARNLRLNYKKSLAALVSIVAGFMSINLFEGYMSGAEDIFNVTYEQRFAYGDLTVHHSKAFKDSVFFDGTSYIAKEDQDKILTYLNSSGEADIISRKLNFTGLITNGNFSTTIMGEGIDVVQTEAMRSPTWTWNTSGGKPLSENVPGVILGEELGRLLKCQLKDGAVFLNPLGGYIAEERTLDCGRPQFQLSSTTQSGQSNAIFLNVSGVTNTLFRELDSRYVEIPLESAQNLMDTDGISLMNIKLKVGVDKASFQKNLIGFTKERRLDVAVSSWKENAFGIIYRQSMSFLNTLRGFFLIVILLIVGFSVVATQTRLVFERITETATLRSLGFKNRLITKIFLAEAFLLSLVGSVFGALLSFVVSYLIKKIGKFYLIGILSEKVPFTIALVPENFLYSWMIITVMTTGACYIPQRKSLRLSINEAFTQH
jgi:putative ABC transport system permease protein